MVFFFFFFFFFFPEWFFLWCSRSAAIQAGDVLEFLVTVNFVSDVIHEFARSRMMGPSGGANELATLRQLLSEYESILQLLVNEV
jgi:hypothetical protein